MKIQDLLGDEMKVLEMKLVNVLKAKIPNELDNKPFKKQKTIPKVPKSVYGGAGCGK